MKKVFLLIIFVTFASFCYAGFSMSEVDTTGDVGEYTSIVLDANGYPHISYRDKTNTNLKYAKWTGSAWSISTVDSDGDTGMWGTSIALDSNGYPHISYYDNTNKDLKYAKWTGNMWSTSTVDSGGDVGWYSSIAVDTTTNRAHISYRDVTNGDLKYARWTGAAWAITTVDADDDTGESTSIALDANGYPHISYYNSTNSWLKYAKWTGAEWSTSTVAVASGYTSIALDANGYPHISYYGDGTNASLRYIKWNGTAWSSVDVVDSEGMTGFYNSLALDTNGRPHISYYRSGGSAYFDLKYAKYDGSTWSKQTIDTVGDVGWYTSISVDSANNPHISYYDFTNGNLKYAKWDVPISSSAVSVAQPVVSSAAATVTISPASGDIKVEIPANTFSSEVNITVTTTTAPASSKETVKVTNLALEITNDKGYQPSKDITITINYRDGDVLGFDENHFCLGRYDDLAQDWVILPSTVYTDLNKVVGTTNHLSKFAVLQRSAANTLSSVYVYPNPYKPGDASFGDSILGAGIVFSGLTAKAKISVYNIAGELVAELDETDGNGIYLWDTKNTKGELVASGVYVYTVVNIANTSQVAKGKFSIIR